MPFLIETVDHADGHALRKQVRPVHLAHLELHKHLLIAAGEKCTDDGRRTLGGIYLLDVETRAQAAAFLASDPLALADVFEKVTILRCEQSFMNGRLLRRRR